MGTFQQKITIFLLTLSCSKLIEANVFFNFGLQITIKDANKSLEISNDEKNVIDNTEEVAIRAPESLITVTSSPIRSIDELRSQQIQLNEAIVEKITSTKLAIEKLNRDLYPLMGRSDFIAAKLKLTARYHSALEEVGEQPKLEILEQYITLVDELKLPPTDEEGGQRSLSYVLMNLLLEKHGILQSQANVRNANDEARRAREVWQRYMKSKLIEVAI